ncbi:hypothetical protein PT974_00940 [Cladobotryum mycophilum]|uniref:Glycosyltransferase 2 n=1 Tax=Cladobotryum mycophilum TaxID=491253 RepID=A0ABR0T2I6_9HYPO
MSRDRGWSLSQLWRGDDEEMANKKDDDINLPRHAKQPGQWQATSSRSAPRRSVIIRFAVYAFIVLTLVYILYNTIGTSDPSPLSSDHRPPDIPPPPPRYDPPRLEEEPPPKKAESPKPTTPTEPDTRTTKVQKDKSESKSESDPDPEPAKTYNGPLKLPWLGDSLRSISTTGGRTQLNRNVLFAAGSLRSAATLLPMACQMAAERDNYVHFALLSRSDIPMADLLKINGIDGTCKIFLHDARPDYSTISVESRMALVTARAFYHIDVYMHPQAVIVDSSKVEEDYFLSGIRDQIKSTQAALIELPPRAGNRFSWLTKLDSSALGAWNDVHFDILVHAPPSGSGNLKRLLNSLARADLGGVTAPHITIELPSNVNKNLENYLQSYRWPTLFSHSASHPQMLSLRHRIPRKKVDEEEASARFLESFWPNRPSHSHVLILSPHTEVTPQFFHYVKYSLLKHRYSTIAIRQSWDDKIFGLIHPPPSPAEYKTADAGTPFLWQSPSSDAILIMGDKWVELHGYVSQYLEKKQLVAKPGLLPKKEVGRKHPAWLEYALQLSRLRGYFTVYPSRQTAGAILGVHRDLYDAPEEYEADTEPGKGGENVATQAMEMFDSGSQVDMLTTLPNEGELPPIGLLPWLSWDGKEVDQTKSEADAELYKKVFRLQVGQCSKEEATTPVATDAHARDLFCTTTKTQAK